MKGISGNITWENYSAIHDDLFTESFNKEAKGTADPFRFEFSTDIDVVNYWVNTIHIHTIHIPPDPDSLEIAIKHTCKTFAWLQYCQQNIQNLDLEEFGRK